jgi:ornithine cyclodeaminase/alanine dehydrogenase-like protein (mu-crystallin family)
VVVWDIDETRAAAVAEELGARLASTREEALAADLLATVTPGHELLLREGSLLPGQHVSLMGADGPGKAEIAVEELARASALWNREHGLTEGATRLFVDDWEQAAHGGETAAAVEKGLIGREDVTELGAVLDREAPGRQDADEVTLFDSTGLAIQDLAIALAAMESAPNLDLPTIDL